MNTSHFIDMPFPELHQVGERESNHYLTTHPYPHICLDGLFNREKLREVLAEVSQFEDKAAISFSNPNENKFASRSEYQLGRTTLDLIHFLNSQPFLDFLTRLTGIDALIPDPYLWGGGFHKIRRGGFLKIHTDFNKHPYLNLDRRLNLLVYLNENWEESDGGHFELWDSKMEQCRKKILPVFNRMVVFSTTDFSYHGHPDPLNCPPHKSRKSIALYYYTNGRPAGETVAGNRITTTFKARKEDDPFMKYYNSLVNIATGLTPPLLVKMYKKIRGR